MGKHRNLGADEKPKNRLKWSDPAVCQHFIVAGWVVSLSLPSSHSINHTINEVEVVY
jgi:hypothetical protein